jgi:hypothetical protein
MKTKRDKEENLIHCVNEILERDCMNIFSRLQSGVLFGGSFNLAKVALFQKEAKEKVGVIFRKI